MELLPGQEMAGSEGPTRGWCLDPNSSWGLASRDFHAWGLRPGVLNGQHPSTLTPRPVYFRVAGTGKRLLTSPTGLPDRSCLLGSGVVGRTSRGRKGEDTKGHPHLAASPPSRSPRCSKSRERGLWAWRWPVPGRSLGAVRQLLRDGGRGRPRVLHNAVI